MALQNDVCKEIGKRGFRTCEPEGISRESSQLLQKVFQALRQENISKSRVASDLHLRVTELNGLVFGLTLTGVEGNPNVDVSADPRETERSLAPSLAGTTPNTGFETGGLKVYRHGSSGFCLFAWMRA